MRTRSLLSLALVLLPLHTATAQQADTAGPRRADSLRQRIEERFASRVQTELGLTSHQSGL
jgi:hypothetical protein